MHNLSVALLFLIIGMGCNNHHSGQENSAYAGQEDRQIKSITDQEMQGYLNGEGMGLSKVAELNNFPGPKHVLEFSEQLTLSGKQKAQADSLYKEMKTEASTLGQRYISAEKELNKIFEGREVEAQQVDSLIARIGKLHAQIRATHVQAHLQMEQLLSDKQVDQYRALRGYGNAAHHDQMSNH